MTYTVKEIFLTQQGEGVNIGRTAVFIRFTGCNLACAFCDTDFIGGTKYDTAGLVDAACAIAPNDRRFAVLTGGEPGLQVDAALINGLHDRGFEVAIETNGTRRLPTRIDWVCVSPKDGGAVVLDRADELKLAFPQAEATPEKYRAFPATHRWLSPIDGTAANAAAAAEYCKRHPMWRLAIQAHKTWSIA